MRHALAIALLVVAGPALAATAYWTGRQEIAQSVTGMVVWNCEYNYAGRTFWRAFQGSCPTSVEVF